jgi:acetyl esterase/lipase
MFVPTIDRSAPLTFIPGVPYGAADGVSLPLDVLCPHGGAMTRRPAAIWLHSGGWAAGSREEGISYWCALMASHGFVAVSVDYRLSGDAIFPAQIHDVKAAIRWLRANAVVWRHPQCSRCSQT